MLEQIIETAKEWIDVITDKIISKSSYAKNIVTLKAEVNRQERALKDAYAEIGLMYYEMHASDGGETCFEPNMKTVLNTRRNIGRLTAQISELQAQHQTESK